MATTYNNYAHLAPIVYKDKAMTSTPTLVLGEPISLVGWRITNPNSTSVYCKMYDADSASDVTLGTTEPCKEFMIPAMGEVMAGNIMKYSHFYFQNGLVVSFVNALATSSTSAPILNIDVEIYLEKPKYR